MSASNPQTDVLSPAPSRTGKGGDGTAPRPDGTAPRPLAERLKLLAILLILPVIAVTVPTLVVTGIFGRTPHHDQPPPPKERQYDDTALRDTLQKSATGILPAPPALAPDPIVVTVRADHLDARLAKVIRQAQGFGGNALEGLSSQSEKRLSVDLPSDRLDGFRAAVVGNAPETGPLPVSAPASGAGGAAGSRAYVEVTIRAAADDE